MNTALKWNNRIFSSIKTAVSGKCGNVSRSIGSATPTSYPAVVVQLLSAPGKSDLGMNDAGAEVGYQVDAYGAGTNKVMDSAEIMDLVIDAFRRMGFRPIDVGEKPIQDNPDVYRITGRFRRYIGSGDDIPRI